IRKGKRWVLKYAPENYKINISNTVSEDIKKSLTETQKNFIKKIIELLLNTELTEETVQNQIFNIIRNIQGLDVKKGFETIYMIILGKKFGPRLGSFILSLDRDWLIKRLKTVLT
ncbi:MAG: hypothetical protein QW739_00970, partial [Candidatus Odinarchaeota archaeon]